MPISLVSVDLDGTLIRSDRTPDPEGVRSLQAARDAGVRVIINTTRSWGGVRKLSRSWGLDDPAICANGGLILATLEGPTWASYTIPLDVARQIARLADRNGWEASTLVDDISYWRQRPGQSLGLLEPRLMVVPKNENALVAEPARILVYEPPAIEAVRALAKQHPAQCRTETYYKPDGSLHTLCVFPVQADKGTALRFVADRLDTPLNAILAIGDNPNDVPMFAAAGISVAMGNAPGTVKEAATLVGPTNDEGGVAWAVERFIRPEAYL